MDLEEREVVRVHDREAGLDYPALVLRHIPGSGQAGSYVVAAPGKMVVLMGDCPRRDRDVRRVEIVVKVSERLVTTEADPEVKRSLIALVRMLDGIDMIDNNHRDERYGAQLFAGWIRQAFMDKYVHRLTVQGEVVATGPPIDEGKPVELASFHVDDPSSREPLWAGNDVPVDYTGIRLT